jgi:uncharacterized membrane protein YGL010W
VRPIGERMFREYGAAHATAGNQRCHAVGIPSIVASVVAAAATVRLGGSWTLAEPLIAAAVFASVFLDFSLAAWFALALAALDAASRLLIGAAGAAFVRSAALAVFAAGWVLQLVGHARYEGNRPAFVRNLAHLLVGPLWILGKLRRRPVI